MSIDKCIKIFRFPFVITWNKTTIALILSFLFLAFIPIDMVNGVLIRSGLPSLSAAYKTLILLLISGFLIKYHKNIYVVCMYSLVFFYLLFHSFLLGSPARAFAGIDMLLRYTAIFVFYLFFTNLIKKGYFENVYLIAKVSFIFLLINLLLGAMGLGYGMYESSTITIGTRGFIFAANEIGAAIIASGAIIMMKSLEEERYSLFFITGLSLLLMGGLMSSKVSILGGITLFLAFPLLKAVKNTKNFKIPKKDFFYTQIIFLTAPVFALVGVYYALFVSNLIARLAYFYHRFDIVTAIFSSRNIWAVEAIDAFLHKNSLIENIFGTGRKWWRFISENKLVEIDPIDFLMTYGILGFVITFGIIFFILFKTVYYRKRNPYAIYVIFTMVLLIAMSSTAGHIFNSGTAGFLIAIVFAMGNYRQQYKKRNCET